MEFLVHSIGKAILKLVQFADSKVHDGTMKKKRFIFPGWHRLRKLVENTFKNVDVSHAMLDGEHTNNDVWVGDSLKRKKNPQHLPPTNLYQKITERLRLIPRLFASEQSAFAFRAATATMSIGILAFLGPTYNFFLDQRGEWALFMIALSMDTHSGQGLFGFCSKILGTVVAMVASMVIWYIGYNKPGAILAVFYIYLMLGIWFVLKQPAFGTIAMISMVTVVLILGYELQAAKIGIKLAESNHQEYYPIYLLAPYRLATVCTGIGVAFIWTYFPYPVTTHSTLQKDLGSTLYLLANFYSCFHTTIDIRLDACLKTNNAGKGSPMYRLDKARRKVFGKIIVMLSKLREHSNFTKWEPTFGGRFPKETYDELITSMQRMFNYMVLIGYSTNTFTSEPGVEETEWLRDLRRFTSELNIMSNEMMNTLCLVSASFTNLQPLPPYLHVPKPSALADRMEAVDPEILSVKHVSEPCYMALAVLEVGRGLVAEEMARTVQMVRELVGEVDFSFHVISANNDRCSTTGTLRAEREDDKGKKA